MTAWFVVFSVLAEFFPRTGDDWAWGSADGPARLRDFFQHLNGRYAGDLLAVSLVRTGPVAAIIVSAVVCTSVVLVLQIAGNRTPLGYGVASLLFLTMPLGTWREAVVWLSGFVNYAFAGLAFLAFLAVIQAEWFGALRRRTPLRLAGVAVLSFVGQLFMENVSLAICAMGVLLTAAYRLVHRRWGAYMITYTLGAVAGAAVMLSNPVYNLVTSGNKPLYQSTQKLSGPHALRNLAVKVFDLMSTQAVVLNYVLNAAFLVLVIALVVRTGRIRTVRGAAAVLLATGSVALSYALWLLERHGHPGVRVRALAAVAAGLLVLAVLVLATVIRSPRRWTLVTAIVSAVVTAGPLIIVNPVGPRCFYPTYLLLMVVVSALAGELRDVAPAVAARALWAPVHLAVVGLIVFFFVVYVSIHNAISHRLDTVRAAVAAGQTTVQITPLPWSYYVHNGDPFFSVLKNRFKDYYGLPDTLLLDLEPNPWLRVPGKPPPQPAP